MCDFKRITSKDNSLIKHISELQTSAKKRQNSGLFVLEGLRICKDADENGIMFDKLIVSDKAMEKYGEEIEYFGKKSNECISLPDSLFKKLSETESPQGVMVLAIRNAENPQIKENGRYIALENINDPSNLGAIARSCEALGADGIIMSSNSCDPYAPKSLRASMGTLLRLPIFILDSFAEDLKKLNLKTYACVVENTATPINSVEFSAGSVVIIGNEANGLTSETINNSDYTVTIPMKGKAESLNASVAGAIAIWEMMK